ncbi:hypothetical protein M407DRAFT_19212 [Tulasnella calospora MUT 4182]|uniref:Uncharacterized protein n=1 Tax=Tulasnella calospora MUT 4182 TaxID=1051891 RepID=A0A0C3QI71_9AGAM|nr:hypothetical protein M407DRAFT_19212 [Tulasnella calospora MUT 4182]
MAEWEDHNAASQHIMREQSRGRLQDLQQYTEADIIADPPQMPELPPIPDSERARLKHGEMELFLKLSASLTVLLARTVHLQDLQLAHVRLLEYLQGYAEMYGSDAVKPNFHWATHLRDQILDYGPVYGFWAFLQERLNFIVKSFHTNNHGQGQLEVTMMRSYSALTSLRNMVSARL